MFLFPRGFCLYLKVCYGFLVLFKASICFLTLHIKCLLGIYVLKKFFSRFLKQIQVFHGVYIVVWGSRTSSL